MSFRISPTVCRRLASVDPNMRYGVAWIPGHGHTAFLAKLVSSDTLAQHGLLATTVESLGQRLHAFYTNDGIERPDGREVPGKTAILLSWPGQAISNAWVTSGGHAAWLEREQAPLLSVVEDIRLSAIRNGRELGDAVNEAGEYAREMALHYDRHNWQTDTTDRTVTREELRAQAQENSRRGRKLRRLYRFCDGEDVGKNFAEYRLWEDGLAAHPKS